MVRNLPFHAEDTGLIPGWRTKIPYATGKLSPQVATQLEVVSPRTPTSEKGEHCREEPAFCGANTAE